VANRKFSVVARFATVTFYLAAVTVLKILLSGKLCLGNLIAMYQVSAYKLTGHFMYLLYCPLHVTDGALPTPKYHVC